MKYSIKILNIAFLLWGIFDTSFCFCQQISIEGQLSIHNSKYHTGTVEYVENAQISAAFSSPDVTDNKGKFKLIFVGVNSGASVKINITKAGLEVVNKRELEDVIIGRTTPIKVFLAPFGELAEAQTELYDIALKELLTRKNEYIFRLKSEKTESKLAIQELERKFNIELKSSYEAINQLNLRFEEIQKRLPEIAQKLGQINLDYASELYKKAFEYFVSGKIEEAINILDEEEIDRNYLEASTNINQLNTDRLNINKAIEFERQRIEQSIESYILKAESFVILFQYKKAIKLYEKAINIIEKESVKGEFLVLKFTYLYQDLGDLYYLLSNYSKANKSYDRAISLNKHNELRTLLIKSGKSYFRDNKFKISQKRFLEELKYDNTITRLDSFLRFNSLTHLLKINSILDEGSDIEFYRLEMANYLNVFGSFNVDEDLEEALLYMESAKPVVSLVESNPEFLNYIPAEKLNDSMEDLKRIAYNLNKTLLILEEYPTFSKEYYQENPNAYLGLIKGMGIAGDLSKALKLYEEAHFYYSKSISLSDDIKEFNNGFHEQYFTEYSQKLNFIVSQLED